MLYKIGNLSELSSLADILLDLFYIGLRNEVKISLKAETLVSAVFHGFPNIVIRNVKLCKERTICDILEAVRI